MLRECFTLRHNKCPQFNLLDVPTKLKLTFAVAQASIFLKGKCFVN